MTNSFLFAVVIVQTGAQRARCFKTFSDFLNKKNMLVLDLNEIKYYEKRQT